MRILKRSAHLGAFNLTDERGLRYYRAAFEYLAHRYSDPAGTHGWISGYVVGNELQSHWAWHNLGRASPDEVTREYADQLRVAWLAPDKPPSEAVYRIELPRLPADRKLVLRFGTTLTGPTHDGVTMSVVANQQVLWTESQLQKGQPRRAAVDLSSYAGQSIQLALRVDARGNNAGDWSHWLQPVVVSEADADCVPQ